MWNAGVVEKVRVGDCGYEDGGEVGYLVFIISGGRDKRKSEVIRFLRVVQWLGARLELPRAGGRCRRKQV